MVYDYYYSREASDTSSAYLSSPHTSFSYNSSFSNGNGKGKTLDMPMFPDSGWDNHAVTQPPSRSNQGMSGKYSKQNIHSNHEMNPNVIVLEDEIMDDDNYVQTPEYPYHVINNDERNCRDPNNDGSNRLNSENSHLETLRNGPNMADTESLGGSSEDYKMNSPLSHSTFHQNVDRYSPIIHHEQEQAPLPPLLASSSKNQHCKIDNHDHQRPIGQTKHDKVLHKNKFNSKPGFTSFSFSERHTQYDYDDDEDSESDRKQQTYERSFCTPTPPPPPFPPPSRSNSFKSKSSSSSSKKKTSSKAVRKGQHHPHPPSYHQQKTRQPPAPIYPSIIDVPSTISPNPNSSVVSNGDLSELSSLASPTHLTLRNENRITNSTIPLPHTGSNNHNIHRHQPEPFRRTTSLRNNNNYAPPPISSSLGMHTPIMEPVMMYPNHVVPPPKPPQYNDIIPLPEPKYDYQNNHYQNQEPIVGRRQQSQSYSYHPNQSEQSKPISSGREEEHILDQRVTKVYRAKEKSTSNSSTSTVTTKSYSLSSTPSLSSSSSLSSKNENSNRNSVEVIASSQRSMALQQIMAEMEDLYDMRSRATNDADVQFWDSQIKGLQQCIYQICEDTATCAKKHGVVSSFPPNNNIQQTKQSSHVVMTQQQEDRAIVQKNIEVCSKSSSDYSMSQRGRDDNGHCERKTVKVRAPADLPGGHSFIAKMKGRAIIVVVPDCGVKKGEVFRTPLREASDIENSMPSTQNSINSGIKSSESSKSEKSNYVSDGSEGRSYKSVKVRAPAELPGGFQFKASLGNRRIIATVPKGGVRKGDVFTVPLNGDDIQCGVDQRIY